MSLIAFLFPISLKEQDREERKKKHKKKKQPRTVDDESDDTTSEVLVISVHQAAGRGADAAAVISSAAPSTGMTPNFVFSLCKDNCNCFTLLQLVRGDSSWQAFGVQVHHKSCLSGVEVGTSTLKWGQTQTVDTKLEELLTSLYSTALRFWLCWN